MLTSLLLAAAAPHSHSGAAAPTPIPAAARQQIATVQAAVARYNDFEVARREGWKKFGGDSPLMGKHWYLPAERGGLDYVHGMALDFRRPSNLMYTWVGGKRVLTGVSFNIRLGEGEPLPEGFAGTADEWHVHDFPKALAAALQDRPFLRWVANGWIDANYRSKGDNRGRMAMVHVWAGPMANPDGPFAHYNRAIPYAKLGLPLSFANGASEAAARGLMLVSDKGCAETIDGAAWIANASGGTRRQLHAACRAAVDHVRPVLGSRDLTRINAMAEHGWAMFDAAWNRLLTPQQRARIAAMNEHGPSHASPSHSQPQQAAPAADHQHGHDHDH